MKAGLTLVAAHPHVCGEHLRVSIIRLASPGSSPRVWGAPGFAHFHERVLRLIPTCVGSTIQSLCAQSTISAHPHVCGEHLKSPLDDLSQTGSSPRVWGAHAHPVREGEGVRLIPTCVGSTNAADTGSNHSAAHPHVCGEHLPNNRLDPLANGSSPRVWGARADEQWAESVKRLIPTCVGSTTSSRGYLHHQAAHPHVCGEHIFIIFPYLIPLGSSPRVWGAPLSQGLGRLFGRLIPTCVGST